jgi:hypothetical protein
MSASAASNKFIGGSMNGSLKGIGHAAKNLYVYESHAICRKTAAPSYRGSRFSTNSLPPSLKIFSDFS